MDFASRFSELRADNDVKQKDLAQLLNVSVSAVSHYEKGLNTPDLGSLILLADFFHVSLDYLAGRSSCKSASALETEIELPNSRVTSGQVIDRLLALPKDQRNDIIRHLDALYHNVHK
ncbi:MAG: helix-turn-helix transcriptional regulator [Oscillospiraceae bacterium]|nr:helix-turn-helix transcriptional regulator [Oscillospiraceae bacterium]